MSEEKLLTIRDVSLLLGISEKEVMDLAENGVVPGYKIGGMYLRFKRHEIEAYRNKLALVSTEKVAGGAGYCLKDKVNDFFYFNDFYILSGFLIAIILYIIFKG